MNETDIRMETLFLNHVLTREYNPNREKLEWCVCEVVDHELRPPVIFGETIQEALDAFRSVIEVKEEI